MILSEREDLSFLDKLSCVNALPNMDAKDYGVQIESRYSVQSAE